MLDVPSCLFVLSLVNSFLVILASFPLLGECWSEGWGGRHRPVATAKDRALKSPSFWIYTRETRVYMCSSHIWVTLTAWAWLLTSCIQVFEFNLDFHCFCSCNTTTRQLHWNERLFCDLFPCSFFSLHIDWGRSHQHSSALLCVSSALDCSAACQKMLALSLSLSLNVLFHTSLNIHNWICHPNSDPE